MTYLTRENSRLVAMSRALKSSEKTLGGKGGLRD